MTRDNVKLGVLLLGVVGICVGIWMLPGPRRAPWMETTRNADGADVRRAATDLDAESCLASGNMPATAQNPDGTYIRFCLQSVRADDLLLPGEPPSYRRWRPYRRELFSGGEIASAKRAAR